MTVNNPAREGDKTDRDASGAAHTDKSVANSDLDDPAMS
jgi:hypothetical protein